jgi:glycerophosphoryl diester phosphodiesterase
MLVLAHRGARRQAPENTLAAFRRARELGADGVELDVHRTIDGVLVVHHDADREDLGVLAQLTAAEITQRVPEIPRLADVLDEMTGLLVNVELKNSPADADFDPDASLADALAEVLAARSQDRVLVSSFHLGTLDRFHELLPNVPTGLLMIPDRYEEDLALAVAHGHGAVHPHLSALDRDRILERLELAHSHGLDVNVWTVNEPADMQRFLISGVDCVMTDVPDIARVALTEPPG